MIQLNAGQVIYQSCRDMQATVLKVLKKAGKGVYVRIRYTGGLIADISADRVNTEDYWTSIEQAKRASELLKIGF
jgi:hypothetical protein